MGVALEGTGDISESLVGTGDGCVSAGGEGISVAVASVVGTGEGYVSTGGDGISEVTM